MYEEICCCRVCGNSHLVDVLDLGTQALTGIFPSEKDNELPAGPVVLTKCDDKFGCGLVQLRQTYSAGLMYGDHYGYQSSLNPSMVSHLKSKVESIVKLNLLKEGDIVLDIGCNDGTTLKFFKESYERVGIDPTADKFKNKYPKNIRIANEFFSKAVYDSLSLKGKATIITSFSMFYDLPDPVKFAREIAECLDSNGVWVFEQSYLPAMLRANSFDTICQEHLEFYALKQILFILEQANLQCIDVDFNEVNGGSFSIVAAHKTSPLKAKEDKINGIIADEIAQRINTIDVFHEFSMRISELRVKTRKFLLQLKSSGFKIYGIGASTKGNVLLQYYGLGDLIDKIGEINAEKYGCYAPGTNIPIVSEEEILKDTNSYLFILPWHFKEFFLSSRKFSGRNLIFPLPELKTVKIQ